MCSTGGRLRDHATALFGGKIRIVVATQYSKGQALWNELKTDKEALSKKYSELKVLEVKVRSRSVIRWAGYQHLPPKKKKSSTVGT